MRALPASLNQTIAFGIFLAGTFVGDFRVGPLPAMWIVFLGALIYLRTPVSPTGRLAIVTIVLALLPGTILNLQENQYFFWVLSALMYLYILDVLRRLYWDIARFEPVLFVLALGLLAGFYIVPVEYETSNVRIFGPNIQYRLYALIYLTYLVAYVIATGEGRSVSMAKVAFLFAATGFSMLETGSRAALFVTGLCAMISVCFLMRRGDRLKVVALGVASAMAVYYFLTLIRERFYRSFLLDFRDDLSANVRMEMYDLAAAFWARSPKDILFGMGPDNPIFPFYPHNIVLELLVYWGVLVLLVFAAIAVVALFRMQHQASARHWFTLFLPIHVGVWFSGDLGDNFVALAFLVYVAFGLQNQRPGRMSRSGGLKPWRGQNGASMLPRSRRRIRRARVRDPLGAALDDSPSAGARPGSGRRHEARVWR